MATEVPDQPQISSLADLEAQFPSSTHPEKGEKRPSELKIVERVIRDGFREKFILIAKFDESGRKVRAREMAWECATKQGTIRVSMFHSEGEWHVSPYIPISIRGQEEVIFSPEVIGRKKGYSFTLGGLEGPSFTVPSPRKDISETIDQAIREGKVLFNAS